MKPFLTTEQYGRVRIYAEIVLGLLTLVYGLMLAIGSLIIRWLPPTSLHVRSVFSHEYYFWLILIAGRFITCSPVLLLMRSPSRYVANVAVLSIFFGTLLVAGALKNAGRWTRSEFINFFLVIAVSS